MHFVQYNKWWGTKHFLRAGQDWLKDGFYCPFPEGTPAYYEYWDEHDHYIKNGISYEGQRIAGLHHLYLNFCPIKDKKKKMTTMPDFWVMDAEYFLEMEKVMGLTPDPDPFRPVVWEVSKTRQCGASLKGCVPVLYNMCFVPFSQNYIGAWLKGDAEKTCNMFTNYFYHAQRYTEFGKRFIKKTDNEYYLTGYWEILNGEKIPAGFRSELFVITWKDNPTKGVGGGCDLFLVEEAGLHPQLLTSLKYITPACKDGDYTTGNVFVYGAAGSTAQVDGLNKLHFNPKAYDAFEYDNIWEPSSEYKKTGYFIPNYSCRKGHIDEDGNPNPGSAIVARDTKLEKLKNSDYENYLIELSQYPNTATEMYNNRGKKRFEAQMKLIDQQIAFVKANNITGSAVDLYQDITTGEIKWEFIDEKKKRPIRVYPLPPNADKEGCVEIFEFPDHNPAKGLYIASIDSYNQEDSYYSTSLGSILIYKRISNLSGEGTHRVLVAEYTGRPQSKIDFFKTCAYLLKMYNAVAMPENEDQELVPWFVTNGYEDLLADQPDIIRQIIPDGKTKRLKGINASLPLIIAAENKIARYIDEVLGSIYDDDGNVRGTRYGVTRILPLALLYELKFYVNELNKNFDRVRTFGWLLLYEEETYLNPVKEVMNDNVTRWLTDTKRFSNPDRGQKWGGMIHHR